MTAVKVLEGPNIYLADSEADTAEEVRLLELLRSVPKEWQQRMLRDVEDQAKLLERVRPYERAGVPDEFYSSVPADEYHKMNQQRMRQVPARSSGDPWSYRGVAPGEISGILPIGQRSVER